VQNVVVAAILGYLIVIGKCSPELGIPGLLLIGGIDLFSRIKAKASGAAALAVGSTGIIGHLPHIVVALAMGTSLLGCASTQCSGLALGNDIVLTATHCTEGVITVAGQMHRPAVEVGQPLTVVPSFPGNDGCSSVRSGAVLSVEDNRALLDTYACFGNSGSPVYDADGNLVGVLVSLVASTHRAVVELF